MKKNNLFYKNIFLESIEFLDKNSTIIICGIPLDRSASFKSGCKFAPDFIRICSDTIESFSPYLKKDIKNYNYSDIGNLRLSYNNFSFLDDIECAVSHLLKLNKKLIFIGGEHTITYPVLKSYKKKYNDIAILHFDAHLDLRNKYLDDKYSHACAMRRVYDEANYKNILHIGCRSYIEEEIKFAEKNTGLISFTENNFDFIFDFVKDKKVYITFDMDFFDPSVVPDVGTPEPAGYTYNEFINFIKLFFDKREKLNCNIIGADIVELSPSNLINNISSVLAANLIREFIILLNETNYF